MDWEGGSVREGGKRGSSCSSSSSLRGDPAHEQTPHCTLRLFTYTPDLLVFLFQTQTKNWPRREQPIFLATHYHPHSPCLRCPPPACRLPQNKSLACFSTAGRALPASLPRPHKAKLI